MGSLNKIHVAFTMMFLSLSSCADSEMQLPRLPFPFAAWAPTNEDERELDSLIARATEFLRDKSEKALLDDPVLVDLAARLRMSPPKNSMGKPVRNFIYRDADDALYFHARLARDDLRFFVPSACYEETKRTGTRDIKRQLIEPFFDEAVASTPEELEEEVRKNTMIYSEITCGDGVNVRLYYLNWWDEERKKGHGINLDSVLIYRP